MDAQENKESIESFLYSEINNSKSLEILRQRCKCISLGEFEYNVNYLLYKKDIVKGKLSVIKSETDNITLLKYIGDPDQSVNGPKIQRKIIQTPIIGNINEVLNQINIYFIGNFKKVGYRYKYLPNIYISYYILYKLNGDIMETVLPINTYIVEILDSTGIVSDEIFYIYQQLSDLIKPTTPNSLLI